MGSSLEVILPLTALAYLSGTWLGAISVCRWAGRPDPRLSGSCNPGFSNVLRQHGVPLALATLAIDALKSWPVLLLGLWLKRTLAGLERARDALEDIASGEGDLTRRLPEQGRDEVAQIAAAFKDLAFAHRTGATAAAGGG